MTTNRHRRDRRDGAGNSPTDSTYIPGMNARATDRIPRPPRRANYDNEGTRLPTSTMKENENTDNATSVLKNFSLLGIYNSLLTGSSLLVFFYPFFLVAELYDAYRASRRNLLKPSHGIEFLVKAASAILSALFILPILFVGAAVLTPVLLVAAFSLRALYHLGSVVDSLFQQSRNWSKMADHTVGFLSNSLFAIAAGIVLVGGGPFAWAGLGIIGAAAGLCYAGYKLYRGYQRWSDERRERAASAIGRRIEDGDTTAPEMPRTWYSPASAAHGASPAASPTVAVSTRPLPRDGHHTTTRAPHPTRSSVNRAGRQP